MANRVNKPAAHKRQTWEKHCTLPPALAAIKSRLESIADSTPAPRQGKRVLLSR